MIAIAALNYTDKYVYDLNSNRTSEAIENSGGTTTDIISSTYNAENELTQTVDANNGTTTYQYDNNGSQTEVVHTPNGTTTPDTATTNQYDFQGQLAGSQVTTSAGTATTTYYYDDSGNRIEEVTVAAGSTTPVTTYYLVGVNNPTGYSQPIEQGTTPASPQITYVWGAQLISETYAQGATIPGVGTASSPTTYYILADAHGSTRLVTNAAGGVVETMNYDAFGNALGFNASTALTTYLYSSMPFDAASGNYYDHARYFDTGTGSFTQADYGYTGSLANPMTDLPYLYGGGNPINLLDLNGHDFSLASVVMNIAIGSMLGAIISPVVAPLVGSAASMLIPRWVTNTILHSAADALIGGISLMGNVPVEDLPVGVVGGFGIEGLWSPFTDNAAVYGYVGAGLSFGSSTESATLAGTVGAVWRTQSSKGYEGPFVTLSIPFASLQQALQRKIELEITTMSVEAVSAIISDGAGNVAFYQEIRTTLMSISGVAKADLENPSSLTANFFIGTGSPFSVGLSLSRNIFQTNGGTSNVSFTYSDYFQLWPHNNVPFLS